MAATTIVACGSCAANSRFVGPRPGTFVPAEYAPYELAGSGRIEGVAPAFALPGPGTPIQRRAVLTPATTWSDAWWKRTVLGGRRLESVDPRGVRYMRIADLDASGHFVFEGLPPGRYELFATTTWMHGNANQPGSELLTQRVGGQVSLLDGARAVVRLTLIGSDAVSTATYGVDRGQGLDLGATLGMSGLPEYQRGQLLTP